jgi:hypothetical protein
MEEVVQRENRFLIFEAGNYGGSNANIGQIYHCTNTGVPPEAY